MDFLKNPNADPNLLPTGDELRGFLACEMDSLSNAAKHKKAFFYFDSLLVGMAKRECPF